MVKTAQEKINDFVVFGSLSLDVVSLIGIDMIDYAEAKNAWEEYCVKLEKKLPFTERMRITQEILKTKIVFGKNKIRELKKKYQDSKQNGEPYKERMNIVPLIDYIDMRIKQWYEHERTATKSFKELLLPSDYPLIKKIGITEFFKRNERFL